MRLRSARAQGSLRCSLETLTRIQDHTLPKGNLLDVARAAALLAAKNTSRLIPQSHTINIGYADVQFELVPENESASGPGVSCRVLVESIDRTGPEMAALTAVNVALLTIYDLLKPIDKKLSITGIRLIERTGGDPAPRPGERCVVLVVSDAVESGEKSDRAGPLVAAMVQEAGVAVMQHRVLPAQKARLGEELEAALTRGVHFAFVVGGSGLASHEITPDMVRDLCDRDVPGVRDAMLAHGRERTSLAMLSRLYAGVYGGSLLVVTLPGSSRGARESLEAVLPGLFQARRMMTKKGARAGGSRAESP
ncbi:MAG: bifunctional molybdenum cofactor biosynthesis protein MoaC/MoaB [Spirochaetales bacterium]|nr:bifunctional molybdenum cofactor biosynthesis protein MoaC/MoaB [Spirochaetales bacterium]